MSISKFVFCENCKHVFEMYADNHINECPLCDVPNSMPEIPECVANELARRDEELALTEKKLCNIDSSARAEIARRDEIIKQQGEVSVIFQEQLSRRDEIIARLKEALPTFKRDHYYCEDCWYSCPKEEDGCCDDGAGEDCNCGADEWNARIDLLMKELEC